MTADSTNDSGEGDDLPTSEDLRWSERAAELPFEQLPVARKQAEGWRNGLAGLTGLLGAASLVVGRNDLLALDRPWRYACAAVLTVAFVALIVGLLAAVSAANGQPGRTIWNEGRALRDWTDQEVDRITRRLRSAAILSIAGVGLIGAVAWMTWLGPAAPAAAQRMVVVTLPDGPVCAELVSIADEQMVLRVDGPDGRTLRTVPLSQVRRLDPGNGC